MSDVNLSDLWASDETRRVDLAPGLWVEIKEELDHGEEQAMQAAAMKGLTRQQLASAVDGDEGTQDVILMDSARLHLLKLAFYLVDWNFKDRQGRVVPLPARVDDRIKLIKRLKTAWGQRLSEEIDKVRAEKARETEALPNQPAPAAATSTAPMPSGVTPLTGATP